MDGKERMTDLIRATITVDPNEPWLAYDLMKWISSEKHKNYKVFQLIKIKDKLKD